MVLIEQGWSALLVSLSESAPFVILGLLLAGLMSEFVPAGALKKRLGGAGIAPVLRSVGLGAVLPICSCSTIPLGLGMTRSGAGTGTALAFMTSAPALSPVTIVLGISLLGPALLTGYAGVVLLGSCVIGLIGNRLLRTHNSLEPIQTSCGCGCHHAPPATSKRLVSALRWATFDLGSEISLSLLAGLVVATILVVFVPSDWVLQVAGEPGPLALLAVVLLALPAYTCSVPALLIAGSLIAKGADPGIAVAFLIAGPATNLGELNAIRAGMGLRPAAYYFAAVLSLAVIASTVVGVLPLNAPQPHSHAAHSHHQHNHLHFGDSGSASEAALSGTSTIALWRWPFVLGIGAMACHTAGAIVIRRIRDSNQDSAVESPLVSGSRLPSPEGQGA